MRGVEIPVTQLKGPGRLIRKARIERGMTKLELAVQAKLNVLTVHHAEVANIVTPRTARKVGAILGLDPATLVTRTDD